MLSKPKNGWSTFELGGFRGRCSYITDVPLNCLDAFICSLKYNIPASVFFDEEGSEFTLVASIDGVYVIVERGTLELLRLDIRYLEVIKEFVNDIETNSDSWVLWDTDYYMDEDTVSKRRVMIESKLSELKDLIKGQ